MDGQETPETAIGGGIESGVDSLQTQLEAILRESLGEDVRVDGIARAIGGASRAIRTFEAITGDQRLPLVLRADPPAMQRPDVVAREAAIMTAARRAGVPVPRVLASGDADAGLGVPFLVMDFVEGESIPVRILRDEAFAEARSHLAADCGRLLARIHALPLGELPPLPDEDRLRTLDEGLHAHFQPNPVFELALRWLDRTRPTPARVGLVHGDFRNGNLMIDPTGIRAVLDWEGVRAGDPLEDLGWLCVRAWRFNSPHVVGGFGGIDQLVETYEQESGVGVDREALRWWQVFGTLRWGLDCLDFADRHLTVGHRSVEHAAIGRRAAENEYDLLAAIVWSTV
jgi:aminoglycoside phosphotransferase (APT) family kinase protein